MKKFTAMLVSLAAMMFLTIGLVGCSNSGVKDKEKKTTTTSSETKEKGGDKKEETKKEETKK